MANQRWYGARTMYDTYPSKQMATKIYEERIVVVLATSSDEAINKAEKEAESYSIDTGSKYLGYVNVFELFDDEIQDGTEVYSLMRESGLAPSVYLDTFFDTGNEKTQKVDLY